MNLSEREWTVLNALWKTNGAELGVLVNELYKETGWNRNTVPMNGGGGSDDPQKKIKYPSQYAADLYINNQKVAELNLVMQKGAAE